MTIYLSGINHDTDISEIDRLKTQFLQMGCTIVTPEEIELRKLVWSENMRLRLSFLHSSNAIYMLPNWKDCILARIELTAAMNDKMALCFSPEDIRELITTLDR
jgi:hypothetical protein